MNVKCLLLAVIFVATGPAMAAEEAGDENTYFESVTALSARLVGNLSLVLSYTVKNNSDVPIGAEKTDTFTALSLEYAF